MEPTAPSFVQPKIGARHVLMGALAMAKDAAQLWLLRDSQVVEEPPVAVS